MPPRQRVHQEPARAPEVSACRREPVGEGRREALEIERTHSVRTDGLRLLAWHAVLSWCLFACGCALNPYQRWHLTELRSKFRQRIPAKIGLSFEPGEYAESLGGSTRALFSCVLSDVFDDVNIAPEGQAQSGEALHRVIISIVQAGHEEPRITSERSEAMRNGTVRRSAQPERGVPFKCFVVYRAQILDGSDGQLLTTTGRGEGRVGYLPGQSDDALSVATASNRWARASYANAQARAAEQVINALLEWEGWTVR